MAQRRPWYSVLYVQVLIAIVLGIVIGRFFPQTGVKLKPLGDAFVGLIRMMIAPIVFCVVVQGISSMGNLKQVGRVGLKALVYFEVVSTLALVIGVVTAYILHPGSGFNINPASLDTHLVANYVTRAKDVGIVPFLFGIIPSTIFDAFVKGDVLEVLFIAVLFGFAITQAGSRANAVARVVDATTKVLFTIIRIIVRAAPIGALGGMAFTVGSYGFGSLTNLLKLIGTFYVTSIIFVLVILGPIAYFAGFSILRFIAYIKDELLIVLGTSSSETVLPDMMEKLERLGVSKTTVGLVFPTGYSFNTDGTNIYLTLCVIFLAQATNTHLSLSRLLAMLLFAMIASKGASGVTGTGFVTLAATLSAVPDVPIQALAILVGIDKFMSECRAMTNVVGNGVATIVVSRWEKELEGQKMAGLHRIMANRSAAISETKLEEPKSGTAKTSQS
ncbi:MAG: dicarboxylate/amino acid:cation symporter [Acidobacteriia bacterium]|nr:dicarboxylate/amino acid:cation symporter [Terriglobia bacterium]